MHRFTWQLALNLASVHVQAQGKIRVLSWSGRSEPVDVYPQGINGQFADFLKKNAVRFPGTYPKD